MLSYDRGDFHPVKYISNPLQHNTNRLFGQIQSPTHGNGSDKGRWKYKHMRGGLHPTFSTKILKMWLIIWRHADDVFKCFE